VKDVFFGDKHIDEKAFVRKEAFVIGDVIIGRDVLIAPGTSIRADECGPFYIDKGTNVQDGVIMHGLLNQYVTVGENHFSIWIGSHCSIAHRALVHGPTIIDKKTFIGFDAVIHSANIGRNCFIDLKAVIKNATIGRNCHIGTGAIVSDVVVDHGRYVADGQIVNRQSLANALPMSLKTVRECDEKFNKEVVDLNITLVRLYCARERKAKNK
jgi:carbon dioxide concentrating mechanism protein CcmM